LPAGLIGQLIHELCLHWLQSNRYRKEAKGLVDNLDIVALGLCERNLKASPLTFTAGRLVAWRRVNVWTR
jgi:hypothetical protein